MIREPRTGPRPFTDPAWFNGYAVTPNRSTRLMLGMPEYARRHVGWRQTFRGVRMAAGGGTQAGPNQNAYLLPSGSWCIASWEMQMQFERTECDGNLFFGPGVAPVVDTPNGSDSQPAFQTFAQQSQIPGVTYDSNVVPLGAYFCRKRKRAASDWHAELGADIGIYPKPVQDTENVPMRRIAHQQGTIPRNSPIYLRFQGPGAPLATNDRIVTFYFGGSTDTDYGPPLGIVPGTSDDGPSSGTLNPPGGRYCITLYGSGRAELFEATWPAGSEALGDWWRPVDAWDWQVRGQIADRQHILCIIPENTNGLNFVGNVIPHYYEVTAQTAPYRSKFGMTGAGRLRLDMREDLRLPFQFGFCTFPKGGPPGSGPYATAIYGLPFRIPFRVAAGASIFAYPTIDTYLEPPPAGVTINVYDAKTRAVLAANPDGSWATATAGQRDYYATFSLSSDTNHVFTPFLRACEYAVNGALVLTTPAPWTGGQIREVAIIGPDVQFGLDHATVLVEDDQSLLEDGPTPGSGPGGLGAHAEVRCQIQTTYQSPLAGPVDYIPLFDGIIVRAPMERTGRVEAATTYPSPRWKTIRLEIASEWYRLNQPMQILGGHADFNQDRTAPDPSGNGYLPWTVINVLHEALKQAGYDDSQMHLTNPDGTTTGGPRLFPGTKFIEDHQLLIGRNIGEFCHHLCKDYLGCRLIWDPFAIPRPRWLTVYYPVLSGSYSTVWTFRTQGMPAGTSGIPANIPIHVPEAWPAGTTFVTNYTRWVEPPEGNLFIVYQAPGDSGKAPPGGVEPGRLMAGSAGLKDQLCCAIGVNWRSTDFTDAGYPAPDPTSLDWVPYGIKPYRHRVEQPLGGTTAQVNEALRFFCRRLMNYGAYGKRFFQWKAPLVFYNDSDTAYGGKPRILRTCDLVTFNEDGTLHTVMITSCNPMIGLPEGDLAQWADYQGFELPVPLSY